MPRVEQTKSMIALSWLLWKYMATNNSISPKEAETPDVLSKQEKNCEFPRRRWIRAFWTEGTHTAPHLSKYASSLIIQLSHTTISCSCSGVLWRQRGGSREPDSKKKAVWQHFPWFLKIYLFLFYTYEEYAYMCTFVLCHAWCPWIPWN